MKIRFSQACPWRLRDRSGFPSPGARRERGEAEPERHSEEGEGLRALRRSTGRRRPASGRQEAGGSGNIKTQMTIGHQKPRFQKKRRGGSRRKGRGKREEREGEGEEEAKKRERRKGVQRQKDSSQGGSACL